MVELTFTIQAPDGTSERYSVLAPAAATKVCLANAVKVGFALLGACYRKEPKDGLATTTFQ